jgi:glucose/arabinose dehydrogenase
MILAFVAAVFATPFSPNVSANDLFSTLTLPDNFKIELFASGMLDCRSMTRSAAYVYVSSFHFNDISGNAFNSNVWAISLATPGSPIVVAANLSAPNGVAYASGDLYIALNDRLLAIRDVEQNMGTLHPIVELSNDATFFNASAAQPLALWHGWRYMRAFANRLYVAIGSPCNTPNDPPEANSTCHCLIKGRPCSYPAALVPYLGTIISGALPNFTDIQVEAHGIRNSVGMDFLDGELYFSDNGRDNMDPGHDNRPPDELNRVVSGTTNKNFGFPFCYGTDTFDPEFNAFNNCNAFVPALQSMAPHSASLGFRFYQNAATQSFPAKYKSSVFVAEHGSWDRNPPCVCWLAFVGVLVRDVYCMHRSGYRISVVTLDDNKMPTSYETFIEGFLQVCQVTCVGWRLTHECAQWKQNDSTGSPPTWGRPVDIELLDDGSLLMTNEIRGEIYRISYVAPDETNWLLYIAVAIVSIIVIVVTVAAAYTARRRYRARTPTGSAYEPINTETPS